MKENKNSDLYLCFSIHILKIIFTIQLEISSFIQFIICVSKQTLETGVAVLQNRMVFSFFFICLLSAHGDILQFTNAQLSEFKNYIILNDKIFAKLWVFFK